MKRGPGPKRKSGIKRGTKRIKPFNEERRQRRVDEDVTYGTHHQWCKTRPCDLRRKQSRVPCASPFSDRAPIEGHHLKTVKTGGQDRRNQLSLCQAHHDHMHALGSVSVASDFYETDLRSLACEVTEEFDRLHPKAESDDA